MTNVVIDTNILFSALLGKKSVWIRNIIFSEEFRKKYKFITCKFAFVELFKHKEKIQKYSNYSED